MRKFGICICLFSVAVTVALTLKVTNAPKSDATTINNSFNTTIIHDCDCAEKKANK